MYKPSFTFSSVLPWPTLRRSFLGNIFQKHHYPTSNNPTQHGKKNNECCLPRGSHRLKKDHHPGPSPNMSSPWPQQTLICLHTELSTHHMLPHSVIPLVASTTYHKRQANACTVIYLQPSKSMKWNLSHVIPTQAKISLHAYGDVLAISFHSGFIFIACLVSCSGHVISQTFHCYPAVYFITCLLQYFSHFIPTQAYISLFA